MVEPALKTPAPVNAVRPNTYVDSVALMRISGALTAFPHVEAASLVMGTPANRRILADAGLLADEGARARPNDLLIALRCPPGAIEEALAEVDRLLQKGWDGDAQAPPPGADEPPRSLATVPEGARLALISTPGPYAAAEALKALRRGMHVFVFSDNVPVAEEVLLKTEAHARGLLVMGPDCGTALLDGIPLGFANAVRRGRIGLIGASGTGLQQVSTLLHSYGAGVSQIIGVGGRDLSTEVAGTSMLDALDLLAADPDTDTIVLVSKPPAPEVARAVLARAAEAGKPVVAAFLGAAGEDVPGVRTAGTLREAARAAAGVTGEDSPDTASPAAGFGAGRRWLRALYAGGTFAYEAKQLLAGHEVATTATHGSSPQLPSGHCVLDLGDDAFTAGRPHPMIEPAVRTPWLAAALRDPSTAVVVVDVVLGHGGADNPAGAVARVVSAELGALRAAGAPPPVVLGFVVGTPEDPQDFHGQVRALREAGVVVLDSSTTVAETAADILAKIDGGAL
ncbi:acyl-CoA synthetase FdrA [Streptomyces sp. NBC_01465]|uniref:acyl-CoA synthetase FdrA n=1 Tax=Streptomyces sp. NBC_01465 TaxID=2903878 RepID=UPI002E3231A1|nr:acyl-CoA synthetase FdrA [Streptomyces sp. NBC_01465]